jgi:hypothetical protein
MIEGILFMLRPLEAFRTFFQQPAKQNFACGGFFCWQRVHLIVNLFV